MQEEAVYQVNAPTVIHELLDGEVLIVHLKEGAYFSLVDTAADIWNALMLGLSGGEIAARIGTTTPGAPADSDALVSAFIAHLAKEALIVPRTTDDIASDAQSWSPEAAAFVVPALDRYSDLEEHMKVDPVHEVAAEGWPTAAVKE